MTEYDCPSTIEVAGDPEIKGERWQLDFDLETRQCHVNIPSLTLISMLSYTPACAIDGVPGSRPVVELRLAREACC